MSDDETAGSSLLLAQHEQAHREHSFHQHQHPHQSLHRRQIINNNNNNNDNVGELVTEIVATISIIQQINVDSHGNTLGVDIIQTHLTPALQPAALPTDTNAKPQPAIPSSPSLPLNPVPLEPDIPSPPIPSDPAPPAETPAETPSRSNDTPTSSPDTTSVLTSIPSDTTTFPSLLPSANSTANSSSGSSSFQSFTNSSRTNTSVSYLTASRSSSLFSSSAGPTDLSRFLPTASSTGGFRAAGTNLPGSSSESTPTADAGVKSDDGVPPTPVVVGGVIGSIAGAAVLIVAILFVLRWRRRNRGMLSLGSADDDRPDPSGGAMVERKAVGFTMPATFASLTNKRYSQKAEAEAESGERGFYRVSGRKLPSVLQTGGDGYGDETPHEHTRDNGGLFRDSHAFFRAGGASSPPLDNPFNRESTGGVPIFRSSPARTPTREQSPFSAPTENTPPRMPLQRPDVLGRSHASQDGSHTSRFTEEV